MIERKVNAMHKYEEFLEKVKTQYSDEFSEMTDIVNRYETLKKTNKGLVEENQQLQEDLDKLTEQAALYEKEKNNEILRMNNSVAELQKGIEKAEDEKNRKQRVVEDKIKNGRVQNKHLSQLLMAVNNLYWMCKRGRMALGLRCENEGSETAPFENTVKAIDKSKNQLDVIGQFIKNYNIILNKAYETDKQRGPDGHTEQTRKNVTQTKTVTYH